MLVGTFKLVYDFHMKSVRLFWRVSLRAIGLFDGDDGHLFAQNLEWNLFDKQTNRLGAGSQMRP